MILGLNVVDWVVIVLAIVVAYTGWMHGFVVGVLSFVGFVGGAALGLLLVPQLLGWLDPGLGASILALLLVLAVASIGQGILAWAGGLVRSRVSASPLQVVDAGAGAVLGVAGLVVAAWAIGLAISTAAIPYASEGVRNSQILEAVDNLVPVTPDALRDAFEEVVAAGGLPEVVEPWTSEPIRGVDAPDSTVARDPEIRAAAESVVKVIGRAECDRVIEGTGFSIGNNRIMTNAHVVAGVAEPVVTLPTGENINAEVVMYDSQTDLAVLAVDDLALAALPFANADPERGTDGVVVGYPNNGPLRIEPVRVRGMHELLGRDIYDDRQVSREVVAMRGSVQPGNSGGPLVNGDGEIYGVVFAASLTDPDTGYALARDEVRDMYESAPSASDPVSTGSCT